MAFTANDLEILVSTMDRKELSFLLEMFPMPLEEISFKILVINQSTHQQLASDLDHIKIINSNEYGLSKSRNLALQNASGKICLIADDDVVYQPRFHERIIDEFNKWESDVILFKCSSHMENNVPLRRYPASGQLSKNQLVAVHSIEIAMNRKAIIESLLSFDERFGLGATFPVGEEFLFLNEARESNLSISQSDKYIAHHPEESSGRNQGELVQIKARAALRYKLYGKWAYLWLVKYVLFLVRKQFIPANHLAKAWSAGIQGTKEFKQRI